LTVYPKYTGILYNRLDETRQVAFYPVTVLMNQDPVVVLLPGDQVLKAYIRETKMRSRRYFVWILVAILCVCLVSYGGYLLIKNRAYERVEGLTRQYAHQVEPFVRQFAREYDLNIVYFKVFEYDR
jgi:hypothetical protein